jgi:hypothetical protein
MSELANWKCHKIVKAGKVLVLPSFNGVVTVEDVNGAPCKVGMPLNAFARGGPELGDYIVIYDDGYKSWSPAKAFEDGYARHDDREPRTAAGSLD